MGPKTCGVDQGRVPRVDRGQGAATGAAPRLLQRAVARPPADSSPSRSPGWSSRRGRPRPARRADPRARGPGGARRSRRCRQCPKPGAGAVATVVGLVTLLFGASGVFGQLQDALNTIWEVQPKPGRGVWGFIRDRFLSFSMVLGTGFLLLVSLALTTALAAMGNTRRARAGLGPGAPGRQPRGHVRGGHAPVRDDLQVAARREGRLGRRLARERRHRVAVHGREVAIGLYLGRSGIGSAYGAAGSLVVLLVWIYYSAQILFFGAEFTQVYANRRGSKIAPSRNAERVSERARVEQGIPRSEPPGRAAVVVRSPPMSTPRPGRVDFPGRNTRFPVPVGRCPVSAPGGPSTRPCRARGC